MLIISYIKQKLIKAGFFTLDIVSRTWLGFWSTIALIFFYIWWNQSSETTDHFDTYPYTLLMVIIATFSYLQNIIIMTLQREQEAEFALIKKKQDQNQEYMLSLMENCTLQGKVIIDQGHLDEARAMEIIPLLSKSYELMSKLSVEFVNLNTRLDKVEAKLELSINPKQ